MLKGMVRRVRMIKLICQMSPKMCALNDFVQSMACRRAEMQILGQITSGSKLWPEWAGDKCIMQEWSKPVSLQLQVQGQGGNCRGLEKSFYQQLPSAISSLYIAFPASGYMFLFPSLLLSQMQYFQPVISVEFLVAYISHFLRILSIPACLFCVYLLLENCPTLHCVKEFWSYRWKKGFCILD